MLVVAKLIFVIDIFGLPPAVPVNAKHVSGIVAEIRLVLLMPAIAPQAQQICGVPLGPLGKAPSLRIQHRAVDILRPVLPYAFVAKPPIAAVPGH
jgi:hypothetical protein